MSPREEGAACLGLVKSMYPLCGLQLRELQLRLALGALALDNTGSRCSGDASVLSPSVCGLFSIGLPLCRGDGCEHLQTEQLGQKHTLLPRNSSTGPRDGPREPSLGYMLVPCLIPGLGGCGV